jgi:hypothetical protein
MTSANPVFRLARAVVWILALVATLRMQEPRLCSCKLIKLAECSASLCTCCEKCLAGEEEDPLQENSGSYDTTCPCSHSPAQECRCAKSEIALTRARTAPASKKQVRLSPNSAGFERGRQLPWVLAVAINESTSLDSCDRCIQHCRLTI